MADDPREYDHPEIVYTAGMDEAEVEARLREETTGVLALADGDDAYAIPLAHHYEDGALLLRLSVGEDSTKAEYIESTETATYVCYGAESPSSSWSILARGTVRELPEDRQADVGETLLNEWFLPFRVFGEAVEDLEFAIYEFEIERVTGRKTVE